MLCKVEAQNHKKMLDGKKIFTEDIKGRNISIDNLYMK